MNNVYARRWEEHLGRTRRWYQRIQKVRPSGNSTAASGEAIDFLYAFFQSCWHLYDWMKISSALSEETLTKFFTKTEVMQICHDICIGAKHLRVDRKISEGFYMLINSVEYVPSSKDEELSEPRLTSLIPYATGVVELFDLADKCMQSVESFLRENNLTI